MHSKTDDAVSRARVLDSLQDSKGREGDPLARLPRPLQGERPHFLPHGPATTSRPFVGMNSVEKPGPVALPLLAKNSESGLEATIPGTSEPRDDVESYQEVVVVVRRVVEPEPRSVPSPLLEQLPLEIELRPSRDRPLHRSGPIRLRNRCERAQRFPAVEGPGLAGGTVPAPVLPLVLDHPVVKLPDPAILAISEPRQHSRGVPDDADLLREEVHLRTEVQLVLENEVGQPSDSPIGRREAEVGEDDP